MMDKKLGTEKNNQFVVDTTAVQTELKRIIKTDIILGKSKIDTNKRAKKVIKKFTIHIRDPSTRRQFESSLAESYLKWYAEFFNGYIAITSFISANNRLITEAREVIVNCDTFRGTAVNLPNRPYITDAKKGIAVVADYTKKAKQAYAELVKNLAKEDAKLPNGGTLRNLAEVKIRWEANQKDIQNFVSRGIRLVWASSHADASTRCAPWQGRLYSLDGTNGVTDGIRYSPLQEAIAGTNGDGNGLLGYNCRHRLIPYESGSVAPNDYTKEFMDKQRKIDQKQRYLENFIRKKKRRSFFVARYKF